MLEDYFKNYHTIFLAEPYPARATRIIALRNLLSLLKNEAKPLARAIFRDFSSRAPEETYLLEIYPIIKAIRYCIKHLNPWMKNRKRDVDWVFLPARAWLFPQPLGVVGIMAPWNYPLYLSLVPLAYAIAAGNRVMIKMSELSCDTAETLALLLKKYALSEWVVIINGDVAVAKAFTALPFNHLLFTGSTDVGKQVMRAASHHLTRLTLELGGKSPVIVSKTANAQYFDRIIMGKMFNAGQTCLAPDYIFLPTALVDSFEQFCRQFIEKHFNRLKQNAHYTSIISGAHMQRLLSMIEEAQKSGARIVKIGEDNLEKNRLAFYMIFSPHNQLQVMQEEIFGPILPILIVDDFKTVLNEIKSRPAPLAIYYFGRDAEEVKQLQYETQSGALSINDTVTHAGIDDLPFGGVGDSGFGSCHGREGFEQFSRLKPMVKKGHFALAPWLYPPYGRMAAWFFKWFVGLRNI